MESVKRRKDPDEQLRQRPGLSVLLSRPVSLNTSVHHTEGKHSGIFVVVGVVVSKCVKRSSLCTRVGQKVRTEMKMLKQQTKNTCKCNNSHKGTQLRLKSNYFTLLFR